MIIGNLGFFDLASRRLDWLAARQETVAGNIANADTPGARAQDVASFEDYLQDTGPDRRGPRVLKVDGGWDQSPDGNTISVEEQTILSTQTQADHALASRLYRKGHEMLILAASSHGG